MDVEEPVTWAPGLSLLSDVTPAAWVEQTLSPLARTGTVASMVPAVFSAYARILPPTYARDGSGRHRWPEIATYRNASLTAETQFDDLVAGSDQWGRPSDGGLDARETAVLAGILGRYTESPQLAYFCVWEGFGLPEIAAWWERPARVRTPDRAYHLLAGPVAAAALLPTPLEWRCASLWWPADRAWLVATDIDGYLTYLGGSDEAVKAVLRDPSLDAVVALPLNALDPSYG